MLVIYRKRKRNALTSYKCCYFPRPHQYMIGSKLGVVIIRSRWGIFGAPQYIGSLATRLRLKGTATRNLIRLSSGLHAELKLTLL